MERSLARPEDAANLGTMGGVIPEAAYMNAINQTNQFSAEAEAMANRGGDADRARGGEAAKEDLPRAGGEAAASRGPPLDWRPGRPIDVARMTGEQRERPTDDELKAVRADNLLPGKPPAKYEEELQRRNEINIRANLLGIKPREGETKEEAPSRVSLETGMKLWNINSGKKTDISRGGSNDEIEVVDECLENNLTGDDLNASQKKR
ncbi:MAG: hypothetical protein LBP95_13015 [Deltaproteobacteria bacterium]|nr:hypothetical protein [Deltaproteobacteria bacterium]